MPYLTIFLKSKKVLTMRLETVTNYHVQLMLAEKNSEYLFRTLFTLKTFSSLKDFITELKKIQLPRIVFSQRAFSEHRILCILPNRIKPYQATTI